MCVSLPLWCVMSLPFAQESPYVMRKLNYQQLGGNERYEGFCVDMLRELSHILRFSFTIKLVDDRVYGAPEPNGSWTGMVGELINRVSGGGGRRGEICCDNKTMWSCETLRVVHTHQQHV